MTKHEHEHDADCDCGCNHDHHHHHEPHHHHEHGADCDCGCNHSDGEAIIENALILSKKGLVPQSPALPAAQLLEQLSAKIIAIAQLVAVDGDVLGHIKALVECAAGRAAISLTSLATPTITVTEGWQAQQPLDSYTLSLNVLSLANTDAPVAAAVEQLFAGE